MRPAPTLTLRQLNRATLARQLLLARRTSMTVQVMEHLVALQAQLARPPFVALWSRLRDFTRDQLLDLVRDRQVVRATMMRATLHLASARDYVRFRAALQPGLDLGLGVVAKRLDGVELDRVTAAGRAIFGEGVRQFDDLRGQLAAHGLAGDERAMGYAIRLRVPLVQVPSDAPWGWDAKAPFALAESWLGTALGEEASLEPLVRRYLAAFGPATPADAGTWLGLRGLRATFDALRPELAVFRDERGRELFDLPDAPRPDAEVDAPVRFLPEFDNLVLGHDDRARVIAPEHKPRLITKNLLVPATFLVDGFVAGTWKSERKRGVATLTVTPFVRLTKPVQTALREEGQALLRFAEAEAKDHAVVFGTPE